MPGKTKLINIKNLVRFLILAIIIYTVILFIGDYGQLSNQLQHLNLLIIPGIMFFAVIDDIFRFYKWDYFLKKLNIRVPFKTSFLIFFSGLAMSITPAKIGEVLKSYLLKKAQGVKMRKSIMVVIVERLTDVLGLAILALIGSFAFINNPYFIIIIISLIFSLIFAFIILTNKKIFIKSSKILKKIPIVKNYVKYLDNIYKSSKKLITVKSLTFATLISTISWFSECFAFYLLLLVLNSPISIFAATFIFSFSSVFGSATFLPGGLGGAESSMIILLLLLGVVLPIASLATVLIRIGTLFYGLAVGIIALTFTNKLLSKKPRN